MINTKPAMEFANKNRITNAPDEPDIIDGINWGTQRSLNEPGRDLAEEEKRQTTSTNPTPEFKPKDQEAPSLDIEKETKDLNDRYLGESENFPSPMRLEAFHGVIGNITKIMAKHCEASQEFLLLQGLIIFGNIFGRSAYVYAGGPYLFPNEFAVCVGRTSRGRKGTAYKMYENLLEIIAPEWLDECISTETQTGEGVVHRIRDETYGIRKRDRRSKSEEPPEEELLDSGVSDKRLLIVEEEFSYALKMAQRSGNTLTETLRKSWDSPRVLRTGNKNSPLKCSSPHISMIGHVTREELLSTIKSIDLSNGYANRILWGAAERTGDMPRAAYLDWGNHVKVTDELKQVFGQRLANCSEPKRFQRNEEAETFWDKLYRQLNAQKHTGFMDSVLARDTSHILKLALIYSIADQCEEIRPQHLKSALAVVDYCLESARWIFGLATGNKLSNNILWELLRRREGMTRTEISDQVCFRCTPKTQIDQALEILAKSGLAKVIPEFTENGRMIERWFSKK